MKRLLVPILALALASCGGLSEQEKAAYQAAIDSALDTANLKSELALKYARLGIPESQKLFKQSSVWNDFAICLVEYQKIDEKLPRARTACKQRYPDATL